MTLIFRLLSRKSSSGNSRIQDERVLLDNGAALVSELAVAFEERQAVGEPRRDDAVQELEELPIGHDAVGPGRAKVQVLSGAKSLEPRRAAAGIGRRMIGREFRCALNLCVSVSRREDDDANGDGHRAQAPEQWSHAVHPFKGG